MEDASAWELSNITLLDFPEDIPRMDQFGEHCWEPTPVPPTAVLHAGVAHCAVGEVMEQEPPQGERECDKYREEVDLPVSSP